MATGDATSHERSREEPRGDEQRSKRARGKEELHGAAACMSIAIGQTRNSTECTQRHTQYVDLPVMPRLASDFPAL